MEVIDTLTGEIEHRFESESFLLYTKVEKLLLSAAKGDDTSFEDLQDVVPHFHEDLDRTDLLKELVLVKNVMAGCEFTYDTLRKNISEYQCVFSQVQRLLWLLFVISATSERSFSALRIVKTFLWTAMKQEKLNHLMIIHIYKERKINIKEVMSEFISQNSERVKLFGCG